MLRPGSLIGVVCDRYGRPSREAYQTLTGEVLAIVAGIYTIRVEQHNGWIVTSTEDESLIFSMLN